MGVKVSDIIKEIPTATATVTPYWYMNTPISPSVNEMGRKTAMTANVEATTAIATFPVPTDAATAGS